MTRLSRAAYRAIGTILTVHRVSALHRLLYRRFAGRGVVGYALGVPMIMLTTTGRLSGALRTNPLVGIRDGDAWLIVATNGGRPEMPAWVANLRAHPRAEVRYRALSSLVQAREAFGAEHGRAWSAAVQAYPGFAVYSGRTTRPIPVFILEPA